MPRISPKLFFKNNPSRFRGAGFGGFTLIEMLIVVGIIGALSTLVLTNTKGSKNKGADTAVRAGLQQILVHGENFYTSNDDNFEGVCDDGKVQNQIESVKKRAFSGSDVLCYGSDQNMAVSATLKGGSTYCVDNDGNGGDGKTAGDDGLCSESE